MERVNSSQAILAGFIATLVMTILNICWSHDGHAQNGCWQSHYPSLEEKVKDTKDMRDSYKRNDV